MSFNGLFVCGMVRTCFTNGSCVTMRPSMPLPLCYNHPCCRRTMSSPPNLNLAMVDEPQLTGKVQRDSLGAKSVYSAAKKAEGATEVFTGL